MKSDLQTYVAFLRGINVGGHHKVPMADLKSELQKLGFKNIVTLLNSGNIIFDSSTNNISEMEQKISSTLEKTFGFTIPTILRTAEDIMQLIQNNPFNQIEHSKEIRLYVSFLKGEIKSDTELPYESSDHSFKIIEQQGQNILSALDLSKSKTPKAMEVLEQFYGKEITTRNWNTVERIGKKLSINSN